MAHVVAVRTVGVRRIAAVRRQGRPADIGDLWKPALDLVWDFLRRHPGLSTGGHNVFVYRPTAQPDGRLDIDFGVQVERDFPAEGEVGAAETPAGEVAAVTQVGPYAGLHEAQAAARPRSPRPCAFGEDAPRRGRTRPARRGRRSARRGRSSMRVLMKISIPVEAGNKAVADGSLPKAVMGFVDAFHPEACYFVAEGGRRTGLFFFDLEDPTAIPSAAEPFLMHLNAGIELTPAMDLDDMKAGVARAAKKS